MRAYLCDSVAPLPVSGEDTYLNIFETIAGGHTLRVTRKYLIPLLRVNARPLWTCDFSLPILLGRNTLILPLPSPYNASYAPSTDCYSSAAFCPFCPDHNAGQIVAA